VLIGKAVSLPCRFLKKSLCFQNSRVHQG